MKETEEKRVKSPTPVDTHSGRKSPAKDGPEKRKETDSITKNQTSIFKMSKKFHIRLHFYLFYFFLNEFLTQGVKDLMVHFAYDNYDKPMLESELEITSFTVLGCILGCVFGFFADSYTGKYTFVFFGNILILILPVTQLVISILKCSARSYSVFIRCSFILSMITGVLRALMIEQLDLNDPDANTTLPTFLYYYISIKFVAQFISHVICHVCIVEEDGYIICGSMYTAIAVFNIVFTFLIRSILNKESIYFNIVIKTFKCICFALKQKILNHEDSQPDWLLHADPMHKYSIILSTRKFLNIFYVLVAMLGFYMVVSGVNSISFLHQITELIFNLPFQVHPKCFPKMFTILLLPLIVFFIIPYVQVFKIKVTFLRCLGIAYALLILAAIFTFGVELIIQSNPTSAPRANYGQLRIYNALSNQTTIIARNSTIIIPPYDVGTLTNIPAEGPTEKEVIFKLPDEKTEELIVVGGESRSYFITKQGIVDIEVSDLTSKCEKIVKCCLVSVHSMLMKPNCTLKITGVENKTVKLGKITEMNSLYFKVGNYDVALTQNGNKTLKKIMLKCAQKEVYAIVVFEDEKLKLFTVLSVPYSGWIMIPQMIFLAFATGLWYYAFMGFLITETPAKLRAWIFSLATLIENAGGPWFIIKMYIFSPGTANALIDVVYGLCFECVFIFAAVRYSPDLNNSKPPK